MTHATTPIPVTQEPGEFASPAIRDSRRLMGPNRFSDEPGAVIDVVFAESDIERADALIEAWRAEALALAQALGWDVRPKWRRAAEGVSCFVEAPVDALMAATELNEQAWARGEVRARAALGEVSPRASIDDAAAAIGVMAKRDHPAHLAALVRAARDRSFTVLVDQDAVSIGTGASSQLWWMDDLPHPGTLDWDQYERMPIALVTGSNGKTTTVRMLAAILREAVGPVAMSSTTGVYADGALVDGGDYAGPAGARMALRDPRARAAVLETARGGILRRGLALYEADVAVVTNVAADHFGDSYGIHDLKALAEVKLVVARAVRAVGTLVLNAEDATLRALGPATMARLCWFSLDPSNPVVSVRALEASDTVASEALVVAAATETQPPTDGQLWRAAEAWTVVDGMIVRRTASGDERVMAVTSLPAALGGAALHNVANALAAAAAASALGVPMSVVASALSAFGREPGDNAGRLERHLVGGVEVVIDYAHNAAALTALLCAVAAIPANRRAVVIGTAGDRNDEALRAMARAAWATIPVHLVIAKELERFARGRERGTSVAVMQAALREAGAPDAAVRGVADEAAAVAEAMAWAQPGDLVVLTVHDSREAVLAQLGIAAAP